VRHAIITAVAVVVDIMVVVPDIMAAAAAEVTMLVD